MQTTLSTFEDNDFWLDIKDIKIGAEIGKGQFSTVYAARYFGDMVAVKKQLRKQVVLEAYILRELSVLKLANHENIVNYIGAYNDTTHDDEGFCASYIVTELCYGGDLLRLLQNQQIQLGWKLRLRIASQTADALHFLHSKNLIHRDIKSSNVLLDQNWNCKISDFGFARLMEDSDFNFGSNVNGGDDVTSMNRRLTICGTEEYMAPEMLFDEEYDLSADIFSFGIVLFELMKRQHAGRDDFLERKPRDKFEIDMEKLRTQIPDCVPESLFMLAEQCISYDPTLRPDSEATRDWVQDLFDSTPAEEAASNGGTTESAKSMSVVSFDQEYTQNDRQVSNTNQGNQNSQMWRPDIAGSARSRDFICLPPLVMPPQIYFAVQQLGGKASKTSSLDMNKSFDTPAGGSAFMNLGETGMMSINTKVSNESLLPVSYSSSFRTPSKPQQEQSLSMIRPASDLNESMAEELFVRYGLMETEVGGMTPTPKPSKRSVSFFADTESVILKEGYLSKLNQTGFRNWKKIWFTLTDKKLSWKSNDPSKRCWFNLKDATITRSSKYRNRFVISQSLVNGENSNSSSSMSPSDVQTTQRSQRPQSSSLNALTASAIVDSLIYIAGSEKDNNFTPPPPPSRERASTADVDITVQPVETQRKRRGHRTNSRSPEGRKKDSEQYPQQNQNINEINTQNTDNGGIDTYKNSVHLSKHLRSDATNPDNNAHKSMRKNGSSNGAVHHKSSTKQPHSVQHASQHAVLFQRELSSNDPKETEEWFHAIEEAILDAHEDEVVEYTTINNSSSRQTSLTRDQKQEHDIEQTAARLALEDTSTKQRNFALLSSPGSQKSVLQLVGVKSIYEYDDVGEWLRSTGLPLPMATSYEQLFVEKGYGDLSTIAQAGLTPADFEFIGITNPAHCRILEGAVCSQYSPTLRLAINGWSRYEGFFVFKVVSRWKYHRSSQYLKLSHFKKFDKALRRELAPSEYQELLIRLPLLPSKEFGKHEHGTNRLSVDFYSSLRRKLETYLLSIAQVLNGSPKLYVFLRFLELVHTLPQGS